MSNKVYLGDSVYADFDGFHIVLTTENGYGPSNTICLDASVVVELQRYIANLNQAENLKELTE